MPAFDQRIHHVGKRPPLNNVRQPVGGGVDPHAVLPGLILHAFDFNPYIGIGCHEFVVYPFNNRAHSAVPVRIIIANSQDSPALISSAGGKGQSAGQKKNEGYH